MADLPRDNLVTDEVPMHLRLGNGRVPPLPYTSGDKQIPSMDERVDSGMGYSLQSQDFSSIEGVHDVLSSGKMQQPAACHTSTSDNHNITSGLQTQLRNLSIGDNEQTKDSLRSNRCDSGICDSGNFSVEAPFIQSAFSECHLTSANYDSFNVQELEELFLQDEDGDTPLHMSIIHLLPDVSLKITSLAPNHDCINIPNNLHQTPLHLAVITHQLLVTRRLMVAGATMEAPDHLGNTALHMACREGLLDMVQCLLTPVHYEETLTNPYSIPHQPVPQDLAIKNYDGYTCAHLALQAGHLDILQLLLSKGADINEQDGKSGRTLLHMAVDMGHQEALHLLLRHPGVQVNARTYGGLTAATLAQGRQLLSFVSDLYRVGADCSQLEELGESSDEEMSEGVYDDICINGEPVQYS